MYILRLSLYDDLCCLADRLRYASALYFLVRHTITTIFVYIYNIAAIFLSRFLFTLLYLPMTTDSKQPNNL